MGYLVMLVLLAAAGIFRLWLLQRRERDQLSSIDGFRTSMQTISPDRPRPRRVHPQARRSAPPRTVSSSTYRPLDAQRRAAAKRRLESRRRVVAAHRSLAAQHQAAVQRRANATVRRPASSRGAF